MTSIQKKKSVVFEVITKREMNPKQLDDFRKKFGARIWINEKDSAGLEGTADKTFKDEDELPCELITVQIENQKSPGESVFFLKDRGVMFVGDALIGKVPGKLNMLPPDKYKDLELAKKGLNKLLDFEFQSLLVAIGPVINQISAKELQDKGVLANCHVNVLQTQDHPMFKNYPEELKWLTTDDTRMSWIAQTIQDISLSGNTLILVDRISAGEILKKKLKDSVFISGSVKTKERKEHYDEVSTTQSKIIIATYGVASVGINIPRIFNLVLIEPGKSFVRVIQSIGRGIRKAEDKDNVQIWDITSSCKFAKRHLTQRKKFYKEANYPYTIEKIDYENPYVRK